MIGSQVTPGYFKRRFNFDQKMSELIDYIFRGKPVADEMSRLMDAETLQKTSPAGYLDSGFFLFETDPESGKTIITPDLTKFGGIINNYVTNIINNNYEVNVTIINPETTVIVLPVTPEATKVAVYYNGARQMPDKYVVNEDNTVTINFTIYEGDTILVDFVAASTHGTILNEIPTGLFNDVNKLFTLTKKPLNARVWKNGKRLDPPDYSLTETGIETTIPPSDGDSLLIDFDY